MNNVIMRPQTSDLQAHNLSFIILHYFGSFLILSSSWARWDEKEKMFISCDVQLFVFFESFSAMVAGEKRGRWRPQNCQVSIERNSLVFLLKKHPIHPEIWATMNFSYLPALVDDHKRVEIDREIERIEASIEMLSSLDFVLLLQIFI